MLKVPKRLPLKLRRRPIDLATACVRSRHVRAFVSRRVSARAYQRRLRSATDPNRRRPERIRKTPAPSRRSVSRRAKNDPNADLRPSKNNPNIVDKIAAATYTPFAKWESLPSRYKLLFATSMAFVICNMDKVNMSVAIIPMARQFGWSATISGLVQSAFFYGYTLCQLPSGFLNTVFSGARMLPIGVGLWSTATTIVPFQGSSVVGLCASRAVVGIGEAVAPGSLTDLVASVVPITERSRSMTFVGAALYLGSLLGLLLSPVLVKSYGWPSVFYVFGGMGLVWTIWWVRLVQNIKQRDRQTYARLIEHRRIYKHKKKEVPWRAILRCRALYALMYTHFCNNWFHFSLMAWLPSYFTDTLSLDLTRAAQVSLIPPAAGITASLIAGPIADHLIARGWRVGLVRKLAQCTAFLGPSLCLLAASYPPFIQKNLIFLTLALGLSSFSLAGLYCNHQDLSEQYSSLLLGITNTAGALTGVLGVATTGALLDQYGSWAVALFLPSIFFFLTGSVIFTLYGSGEAADLSNNAPFAVEKLFKRYR